MKTITYEDVSLRLSRTMLENLTRESKELGITLSQYVESILSYRAEASA